MSTTTVYVVEHGEYSRRAVVGVFATLEAAQQSYEPPVWHKSDAPWKGGKEVWYWASSDDFASAVSISAVAFMAESLPARLHPSLDDDDPIEIR